MYRSLIANLTELRTKQHTSISTDVGIVGFSMGGHWAIWLAQRADLPVASCVIYYAARAGEFANSHASFLAHFAENDEWVRPDARRRMEAAIRKAQRPYTAFDYPGTYHWFAEEDRAEEHAPEPAALAFERTVAHLNATLSR
jgi:carboxymethylenebutenolidase